MDDDEEEEIEKSSKSSSEESEEEEHTLQQIEDESLHNKEKRSMMNSISPSSVLTTIAPNDSSRLKTG